MGENTSGHKRRFHQVGDRLERDDEMTFVTLILIFSLPSPKLCCNKHLRASHADKLPQATPHAGASLVLKQILEPSMKLCVSWEIQ